VRFPFSSDFLRREWPLVRASCSVAADPAALEELAAAVSDSESLLLLAEKHGVLPQLGAALGRLARRPPFEVSARARRRRHLLLTLALSAELWRVLELFERAGMESLVFKGPALSLRAYGDPAARQYADLDFLMRHSGVRQAAALLLHAGYEPHVPREAIFAGRIPGEYLFRRPGTEVLFELHSERTFRYFPRRLPIEDYFRRKVFLEMDGRRVPALSAEDEFVLIAVHGAKHFWERLLWITDVAAMVGRPARLDFRRVRESAAAVGAERMVRVALVLAERVVGLEAPPEAARHLAGDAACRSIVEKIEGWLPYAGSAAPGLAERALFRLRTRGSFVAGVGYLARLSLSPTEEDWSSETPAGRAVEILGRPIRLARKYRRTTGA
jgi:hypothetical protein